MWDLVDNPDSIALIESFYDSGKPVAAVCHPPGVFHGVERAAPQRQAGDRLYQRRRSGDEVKRRRAVPCGRRAEENRGPTTGQGTGGTARSSEGCVAAESSGPDTPGGRPVETSTQVVDV